MVYYGLIALFSAGIVWCVVDIIRLQKKINKEPASRTEEAPPPESPQDTLFIACENVRKNVADAAKFLKEKLAKSVAGFRAFHQMPWYLVIGPQRSGKTTLLSRSDLNFLETERFVQLTPAATNTSGEVNWWFTQSAAILDVPGNFLDNSAILTPARAAWLELLRQLKRLRFRRPINGVILAIDAQRLANLTDEASKNLRARLQEIAHRLKQRFPVYILCTQTDKVQGFTEYFDDLGKTEREQHLGITFPLHFNQKHSPADVFAETFDALLQNLHQRALWRIHHERDKSKRQAIQHFPYQLSSLKNNLQKLIYDLSTSTYQSGLRGVYFTSSATEDEQKIDSINDNLEKHFALMPRRHSQADAFFQQSSKAFFIKQLFGDRIFPESALANDTLRHTVSRQEEFLRFGALGVAAIALISITILWSHQYQHQQMHLNTAKSALSDYKLLSLAYSPNNPDLTKLVPSLDALRLAHTSATDAKLPWLLRFQLHHEKPVSTMTNQLYQSQLQTKLIPAVRQTLAAELESGNITDSTTLYGVFKAYLMLGDPAHADKQFLEIWFTHDWQNPAAKNPAFMSHLTTALRNPLLFSSPSQALVTQIRANLNALPYPLLAQAIMQNSYAPTNIQPLSGITQHVFNLPTQGIPTIFTTQQLSQASNLIDDSLSQAIQGNWVLGQKPNADLTMQNVEALQQTMINNYAQDYANVWQNWLSGITLRPFQSTTDLALALQELTSQNSPLAQILRVISTNTNMTGIRLENTTFTSILQSTLAPRFSPLYAIDTAHQLHTISAPLQQLQKELHKNNTSANTITTLLTVAGTSPAPVGIWINSLVTNQRNLSLQNWQKNMYPACHTALDNAYPFNKNATTSVPINTFIHYFAMNGVLNQFFTQNLLPYVNTTQADWQWQNTSPTFAQNNAPALSQFERANVIRELYFNSNNQLSAPFGLELVFASPNIAAVQLTASGKTITENAESGTVNHFVWPQNTQNMSITLVDNQGQKHTLSETGAWAIFKLMDAAQVTATTNNQKLNLSFTIDGNKVEYILVPASPLSPFIQGVTSGFQCPGF